MSYLRDRALAETRASRERRTSEPLSSFGRLLTCTACGTPEMVFEAAQDARDRAGHEYNDPAGFRCGDCLGVIW